jgi:antitoxin StbD
VLLIGFIKEANMIIPILADATTSISELKKNPMSVVEGADGFPVAVLNRNRPVFYCVPAAAYEALMDKLEDLELAAIVAERVDDQEIEVDINDL